jgi:drug/metabolite transporter (DMT)-like permease
VPACSPSRPWWAGLRPVVVYGLVPIAGCQLCYFEAVQHLSVAVALLLEYSGTLMVVGWQWARDRCPPGRLTRAGALAAVAGLVLVLDLTGHQHADPPGVLWGLGAAVGLAVYFVAGSRDGGWPPLVLSWGGLAIGAAAIFAVGATGLLPLAASQAPVTLAHTRISWVVPVLGLGVVAAAVAYVTGIAAVRALGARVASFVGLTEVMFSTFYAWAVLGQQLAALQLVGGVLVILGILLVRADRAGAQEPAHG